MMLLQTITKTVSVIDGNRIEKTVVLLDKKTTRDDVINACDILYRDGVQLTFEKLVIGNSMLGIVGKKKSGMLKAQFV
jgi:hypothetical protein